MIVEVGDMFTAQLTSHIYLFAIIESKLSEEKFVVTTIAYNFNKNHINDSVEHLNIDYIQESFTPFKDYNKLDLFKRLFI
jgi:hypothetical protein